VNSGNCTAAPPTASPTFTGPSMSSVGVIASPSSPSGEQQFNAPLSAALLLNGNLAVGNADQDLTPNDGGTSSTSTMTTQHRQDALEIASCTPRRVRAWLLVAVESRARVRAGCPTSLSRRRPGW
jgi:hypothetical protein